MLPLRANRGASVTEMYVDETDGWRRGVRHSRRPRHAREIGEMG